MDERVSHSDQLFDQEASFQGSILMRWQLRPPQVLECWANEVVSRIFASWNQLDGWLRQVQGLKRVA
jgi:hypothetical protein